jgi:hypothetical protein
VVGLGLSRCSVRAGLHACGIVTVSYQSERVVCTVDYWERCVTLFTCESGAEEIFTLRVSVVLSPEGVAEISLWYINTRLSSFGIVRVLGIAVR